MITSGAHHADVRQLSGVFKNVLAQHGEAFAQVKRLGMRSDVQRNSASEPDANEDFPRSSQHLQYGRGRGEMVQGYAALKAVVESEHLLESEARPSDLADAMAALDAINPGSPEWGPTFLQVSELVEARLRPADDESRSMAEEEPRILADS